MVAPIEEEEISPIAQNAGTLQAPPAGQLVAAPAPAAIVQPPPPALRGPQVGGPPRGDQRRGKAHCQVELPGGTIAFYTSKSCFQAVCGNALHGACVLTRGIGTRVHMGGRPCGLLSSWLAVGGLCETKEHHWQSLESLVVDRAARLHGRELLAETPGSAELLAMERTLGAGEEAEPP